MIAYISPLIPKKTGIAQYSHHLIMALQTELAINHETIDIFDDQVAKTNSCQQNYQAKELLPLLFEPSSRVQYRQFIYHFGNNPEFHLSALKLLQQQKGIVVLHDTVLFFLLAGLGTGGLWQILAKQSATTGYTRLQHILADCPQQDILRYPFPEKQPFLQSVLSQATAVVVHSLLAEQLVREANYQKAIFRVPLIDYQQPTSIDITKIQGHATQSLFDSKTSKDLFYIGLFGFSGNTKRSEVLFKVLSALPADIKSRIKLIIVGAAFYQDQVTAMGLSKQVHFIGYISDDDYDQCLAMCDLIVNLRYPSMGETSAVQIQAMSAEKPTLVSNHGWFSELPDQAVYKIPVDQQEAECLTQGIIKMFDDNAFRLTMAKHAKQYVKHYHNPAKVATQWVDILSTPY
ncbi:MAG TPA: glycosyltransferase [Methyloprofundus sp.]|nr:glycosyltransferase [Methyloprofundus sp.]